MSSSCSQEPVPLSFSPVSSRIFSRTTQAPVTLTEAAVQRLILLREQKTPHPEGLRLELRQKGCSGVSYDLVYVDEKNPKDLMISQGEAVLFLDPRTLLYVTGMVIDYIETPLEEGFQFTNPQAKGRCGCGDSDYI
jgi:iron-sulfur cluster assembly protein